MLRHVPPAFAVTASSVDTSSTNFVAPRREEEDFFDFLDFLEAAWSLEAAEAVRLPPPPPRAWKTTVRRTGPRVSQAPQRSPSVSWMRSAYQVPPRRQIPTAARCPSRSALHSRHPHGWQGACSGTARPRSAARGSFAAASPSFPDLATAAAAARARSGASRLAASSNPSPTSRRSGSRCSCKTAHMRTHARRGLSSCSYTQLV